MVDNSIKKIIETLNKVLVGKQDKILKIVATILANGNILLEDIPGVGKTLISKAIARLLYFENEKRLIRFSRIQGTPDLLPYDITGVDIYNPTKNEFVFKHGPIFSNVLLFDELNRTTPKVQSALLEAMAERQVTVSNRTYNLNKNFFVIATQNPVESEGVYTIPQAMLDRFMIVLKLGYPSLDYEKLILENNISYTTLDSIKPILSIEKLENIKLSINNIETNKSIIEAIANIAEATRVNKNIKFGLSTRSSLMLLSIVKANAYLNNRDYVIGEDLIDLSVDVLSHRLTPINSQFNVQELIDEIARIEVKKIFKE